MITKCRFCDYSKETPLSLAILEVMVKLLEEGNIEDFNLWAKRAVKLSDIKDWDSVKIHMGMKHKGETYKGIWPNAEFSEEENEVINQCTI